MNTTLNLIRAASPCKEGWQTLLASLSERTRYNAPLSLIQILESNGLDDAVWALRACPEALPRVGEFARRAADRARAYATAGRYARHACHACHARQAAARYAAANARQAAARYAATNAADAANVAAAATAIAAIAARYAARYAATAAANAAGYTAGYTAERAKQESDFRELFA